MKRQFFFAGVIAVFLAEIAALIVFALQTPNFSQDAVEVNEVVQSVTQNFNDLDGYENSAALDYVVLDNVGNVLYKTKYGLSESINAAVTHRDTLLDITIGNEIVGKVIIYNDGSSFIDRGRSSMRNLRRVRGIFALNGCKTVSQTQRLCRTCCRR